MCWQNCVKFMVSKLLLSSQWNHNKEIYKYIVLLLHYTFKLLFPIQNITVSCLFCNYCYIYHSKWQSTRHFKHCFDKFHIIIFEGATSYKMAKLNFLNGHCHMNLQSHKFHSNLLYGPLHSTLKINGFSFLLHLIHTHANRFQKYAKYPVFETCLSWVHYGINILQNDLAIPVQLWVWKKMKLVCGIINHQGTIVKYTNKYGV